MGLFQSCESHNPETTSSRKVMRSSTQSEMSIVTDGERDKCSHSSHSSAQESPKTAFSHKECGYILESFDEEHDEHRSKLVAYKFDN